MEQLNQLLTFELFIFSEQSFVLGQLILVPIVVLVGYLFIRKSSAALVRKMRAQNIDRDLILLIQRLYFVSTLFILGLIALWLLNVPLTAFAFVSGALAIGVGFGAQNIVNNFISGWILMWERPIRIGDLLEIGDVKGTVETINTRSTRIRRVDGVHMLVPNSFLLENTVVNWTLMDKLARGSVRVGVAYGSPVRKVAELIEEATLCQEDVLKTPEPYVIFEDFGDSALIFDVNFWVKADSEKEIRVLRSNIRYKIDELFEQNNIVISFPQQDIHLDGNLSISKDD